MPDQEERLRLVVELIDRASPEIKKLTQELKDLGGHEMKRSHEAMRRETNETRELVKRLTGDLGEAIKYLGAFRTGLVSGTAGLVLFGFEMAKQIAGLKTYADTIKNLKLTAENLGID